jgi:cytoskeletal protein CcmA (bactofilin family)
MSADAMTRADADDRDPSLVRKPESVSKNASDMPRMVAPAIPPLVPSGGIFEGEVAVLGDTRIEGRVVGSLRGPGRIVLGPEAKIEGELECDEVDSEGAIRGPIDAHHRVRLRAGARLDGDIQSPSVEVADSAVWNGTARVGELPVEPEPQD